MAQASLAEVKAAASELLREASDPSLLSRLSCGASQISVTVKAGDVEVSVSVAGPEHTHDHDDEEWVDDDELFDDDDDDDDDDEEE